MQLDDFSQISLQQVGAALAALSALATAAFGLLDSTKAFWGGVSNIGLGHLWRALTPYDAALNEAVGREQWRLTVRANWINGMAKDRQKAVVGALLKLGLTAGRPAASPPPAMSTPTPWSRPPGSLRRARSWGPRRSTSWAA